MEIYIYKTNILNQEKAKALNTIFSKHSEISRWTVDTEDIDKVLKVESKQPLAENELMQELNHAGFSCEVLAC
jgi:tRNA G26 N,N-dimethylase Trm1